MTPLRDKICLVFAVALGIALSYAAVLVGDHRDVLQLHSIKVVDVDPQKRTATMVWDVTELRSCAGVVNRVVLVSLPGAPVPIVYNYAPEATSFHIVQGGTRKLFYKTIALPPLHGSAKMFSYVTRWCNPLQEWLWPIHDVYGPTEFVIEPVA